MLLYHNHSSFRIIFTRCGSIFFRSDILALSFLQAATSFALQLLVESGSKYAPKIPHNYGIVVIGSFVVFAVVFRTQLAWGRFWEAIGQIHLMYGKWGDSYAQMLAFACVSIEKARLENSKDARAKSARLEVFVDKMTKYFGFMSALASHRLLHGDTERMEKRSKVAGWGSQIVLRREIRRSNDGTGFDNLPAFEVKGYAGDECLGVGEMPRQSSQANWDGAKLIVHDELSHEEMTILKHSQDRTSTIMFWILCDFSAISGDLAIPPPIQSRMYQEMSNGMLGFSQSLKLADVPFPFPFAQSLALLLIFFSVFSPIYVTVFSGSLITGPILSFMLFDSMWGFNEVAKELENPYGKDVNDVSLVDFHNRFVETCDELRHASRIWSTSCYRTLSQPPEATNLQDSVAAGVESPFKVLEETMERRALTLQSTSPKPSAEPAVPSDFVAFPCASPDVVRAVGDQLLAVSLRMEQQLARIASGMSILSPMRDTEERTPKFYAV